LFRKSKDKKIKQELVRNPKTIYSEIGASLAGPGEKGYKALAQKKFGKTSCCFEKEIDRLTVKCQTQKIFILAGGKQFTFTLRQNGCQAGRGEEQFNWPKKKRLLSEILIYINRLSDLFLRFARYINYKEKQRETIWTKG